MLNFRLIFIFILQVLLWSASVVSAGETSIPVNHPQAGKDCFSCHQDEEHKNMVLEQVASSEACVQCHAAKQVTSPVVKTAQASEQSTKPAKQTTKGETIRNILESEDKKTAPDKHNKLPITAGMQYPMYYQGTRLGEEPNEMVLIPTGEFTMGTDGRLPDEGPQHKVTLPAFYIDIYEVTNLQYKKFNDDTQRRSPTHFRNRTFPEGKADHPVTYVSWEDANAYCQWVGKRLPTDQEWEKAARGTDARWYPWGEEFDSTRANTPLRWQEIGAFGDTTPVGAFEGGKSPYGLYDMSGNVWEWTASWYTAYPDNTTPSESYGERYKTLKGGSWFDCSFYKCGISAPVFNRAFFSIRVKNDSFGFRCAKDAGQDVKSTGKNK